MGRHGLGNGSTNSNDRNVVAVLHDRMLVQAV